MILYKLTIGYLLDLIFGDPYWLYHPIRIIGKIISTGEKLLRGIFPKTKKGELSAGAVLTVITVGLSFGVSFGILKLCAMIHPALAFIVETFWIYQILAGKCLKTESMKVYDALAVGNLPKARRYISYLVGRDTKTLSEEEVIKATVETVAENTTDGVIAPLLFIAIGGAPLGFAYKAVNTLDSMIGYKNEKYIMFGKAAARLDDLVNFIPARISGLLMIFGAALCGYSGRGAAKTFIKDRKKHLSPNSAQTESACAGALGISLGGTHAYFGKPVVKPAIGEVKNEVCPAHIKDACLLMFITSFLMLLIINAIRFALIIG